MHMDVQIKPMTVGTLLLVISSAPGLAQALYLETGTLGDPASWRSAEFQRDWGPAAEARVRL
jgi:subtilase-type serine protease